MSNTFGSAQWLDELLSSHILFHFNTQSILDTVGMEEYDLLTLFHCLQYEKIGCQKSINYIDLNNILGNSFGWVTHHMTLLKIIDNNDYNSHQNMRPPTKPT